MVKFEIPLETPSLNKFFGRSHWSKRASLVKLWNDTVYIACKEQGVKPPSIFPVRITTQSFYKGKGRVKDTSNTFPANKLIEDGLVKAGVLPDDTIKYVSQHLILAPEFNTGEDKVIVWIEELEEVRKKQRAGVFCEDCHKEL